MNIKSQITILPDIIPISPSIDKSSQSKYEQIRYQLLAKNFVFRQVLKKLGVKIRKIYSKKKKSDSDFNPDFISNTSNSVYVFEEKPLPPEAIRKDIQKLGAKLKSSSRFITNLIDGAIFTPDDFDMVVVTTMPVTIDMPGIYIRVDPRLTDQEQLQRIKKAKDYPYFSFLYPDIDKKTLNKKGQRDQIGYKDESQNLRLYLDIETRIPKHWKEHQKGPVKNSYAGPGGEKERTPPVVLAAIEELLELQKIYNPQKNKELKSRYKDIYYKVARRYKLPTVEELHEYLRLIDSPTAYNHSC